MDTLTLRRPDDWHVHLRQAPFLADVLPFSARQFARALLMPNLKPPLCSVAQIERYQAEVRKLLPQLSPKNTSHQHSYQDTFANVGSFEPFFALYLHDHTALSEIAAAHKNGHILGFKLYPAHATTGSAAGVQELEKLDTFLAALEQSSLALLVHAEVTDPEIDVFEREAVFVEKYLWPWRQRFPKLRIVLEHVSSQQGVEFVLQGGPETAATVTPQHLCFSRNVLFQGGLRPHNYCLPVIKTEADRQSILQAVMSGHPRFFLGTDSAPHAQKHKESSCCAAGVFSAYCAIEFYAEIFEKQGCLDKLENFASVYGAQFYGLPLNTQRLTLIKTPQQIPAQLPFGGADTLVPWQALETCSWQVLYPQ